MIGISPHLLIIAVLGASAILLLLVVIRRRRGTPPRLTPTAGDVQSAIATYAVVGKLEHDLTLVDPVLLERELTHALTVVSGAARDRLSALAVRHDFIVKWGEALRSGTADEKLAALASLALLTDASVVPTLTDALNDDDARVRVKAAELLRTLRVELRGSPPGH